MTWTCPACEAANPDKADRCLRCKTRREKLPSLPPPRPRMRTDPELYARRVESMKREAEVLKQSYSRIEMAKTQVRGPDSLTPPTGQMIVVPNTWWGWLLVVLLGTLIVLAMVVAGYAP